MNDITYNNLSKNLIRAFPELTKKFDLEVKLSRNHVPGQHIIYGDVLNPYLTSLLEAKRKDTKKLTQIFNFLEELANNPDVHIQEVVAFTVCEHLLDKDTLIEEAKKYMGPKTIQFVNEITQFRKKI